MTGTHHALTPIGINNRMTIGFDTIIYPASWLPTLPRAPLR